MVKLDIFVHILEVFLVFRANTDYFSKLKEFFKEENMRCKNVPFENLLDNIFAGAVPLNAQCFVFDV